MKQLQGIIAALVTPLTKNNEFDSSGMNKLLNSVLSSGVHGVFVLGSMGEGNCFSFKEREEIISFVIKHVGKKIPVLVGTGRNSTAETLECTLQAERLGADYAVVMPPVWRKHWITQQELTNHYLTLTTKSNIPIIMYNLPNDAVPIEATTAKSLYDNQRIVGIKESSCVISTLKGFVKCLPTFQGDDSHVLEALKAGASGAIVGFAGIFPEKFVALYDSFKANDFEKAEQIQKQVNDYLSVVLNQKIKNPLAAEKYILELEGLCQNYVRTPYIQISQEEKSFVKRKLESLKDY